MFRKMSYLIILVLSSATLFGQESANSILQKSIEFHDPNDNWKNFDAMLNFEVIRPDKPNGKRKVSINNKKNEFRFWAEYEKGMLHYQVVKNNGKAMWNDSEAIPEEIAEEFRISTDRAMMYRDYYTYLYGMPMKLKDPGTIIDPNSEQVVFYGKKYLKIKVSYTKEVGDDTWYFYFNPNSYALEAYQFFKDESKNDGEYILFEKIKLLDGVKIPATRHWYYNKDEKYLASDVLK